MNSFNLIEQYCLWDDLSTYDPYDIWKTSVGIYAKKLYYKNKYLGLFPAGMLTIYDLYINNTLRLGYKKQEYPIVRAQAALALMNLYKKDPKPVYLEFAKKHIDWLLENSSKEYSGYCWGTGFKIVITDKLVYDESVPFSTNTPYVLEALAEYYRLTNDESILEIIKSIYQFYEKDLVVLKEDEKILITSYGPFADRIVTNAVSYTMFAYSIFYRLMDDKEYIATKITKMYAFISSVQREDGGWFYAPYDSGSFIDCFHSAFVLKNIIKTIKNIDIPLSESECLITTGYAYIKNNFYDSSYGLFKRFAISNKPSLSKFDLYDNAEMLYLSKLIGDRQTIEQLEKKIKNFYSGNNIYSMIDFFGMKKNKNMLRWAVMPYVLAKSL